MNLKYIIDSETSGKTVKYILKKKFELSERLIKKLKHQHRILCNSEPVYINAIVSEHDIIEANTDFEETCDDIIPENIPIDIIFEDDNLIVINKQPDIVVHPTCAHISGTLANAVAYHLQKKGIVKKVRPVIRLDKDTSGIIIFAKNAFSQEYLIRQMNNKTFIKKYIGIVHGFVNEPSGTIAMPIARKPGSIMLRHISPEGDHSVTHYKVLEYLNNATVLEFRLETGRTHQIRVHCQAINHPLIGDTLYPYLHIDETSIISNNSPCITQDNECAQKTSILRRQALHSYQAIFEHPETKKSLELSAPIPRDINCALEILRK